MKLAEKLRHLRSVEGFHRGLERSMTKAEVVRAMHSELGEAISHPYLCQLESGARVHMTARTRDLLARFFKVLPGYLVGDLEGFEVSLQTDLLAEAPGLRGWFATQAESLRDEPFLAHVMFKLSRTQTPEQFVALLDRLLELPPPALDRVVETLRQEESAR